MADRVGNGLVDRWWTRGQADSLAISQHMTELNAMSHLALLAEKTYQQGVGTLVQAGGYRCADTIAAFAASGDGWWNHDENVTTTDAVSAGTERHRTDSTACS